MTTPTTNVTFSSIQTEFGGANPISMSEYYRGAGGGYVSSGVATSATDGTAISTSGTIRVGMFRGVSGISYAISINTPLTIDEGSNRNFVATTTGIANGTVLYWTVSHGTTSAADFVSTSGTMTISSNSATGVIQISADSLTEGSETFSIQLRTGSTSGTVVATSQTATINDTSTAPTFQYSLTAPAYYWGASSWVNQASIVWNGTVITSGAGIPSSTQTSYTTGGFTYTRGTFQSSVSNGSSFIGAIGTTISLIVDRYSLSRT